MQCGDLLLLYCGYVTGVEEHTIFVTSPKIAWRLQHMVNKLKVSRTVCEISHING